MQGCITTEQKKRWEGYTYHMYLDGHSSNAYKVLYPLDRKELASMVVAQYEGAVKQSKYEEVDYSFMLEQFVDLGFPNIGQVPPHVSRRAAIRLVRKVNKAWLIEYIYASDFARIEIPEDNYYIQWFDR